VKSRIRHLGSDALASVGVLAFVLTVLVSVDERVREQAELLFSPGGVGSVGVQLGQVGSALVEAAKTQSIEHAPMMTFIVVATVLLLGMMRS
jgi:hypothetical protein